MNKYVFFVVCAGMLGGNIPASQLTKQHAVRVGILDQFTEHVQEAKDAKQAHTVQSTIQTKNDLMIAQLKLLCIFDMVISSPQISDEQKEICVQQLSI